MPFVRGRAKGRKTGRAKGRRGAGLKAGRRGGGAASPRMKAPASLPWKDGGGLVVVAMAVRRARYMRRLTFSGDSLRSSRAANTDME